MIRVLYALAAAGFAVSALAQTPNNVCSVSTEIAQAGANANGDSLLRLSVTNISQQPIKAYAVRIIFSNPVTNKRIVTATLQHLSPTSARSRSLQPGATEASREIPLPLKTDGTPLAYTPAVDLILFDDGSTCGPAASRDATRLLAAINQAKQASANPK